MTLDCRTCGACCVNLPSNQAEDFHTWVEVDPADAILARRDLVKKLVVYDDHQTPHLRVTNDGRCLALRGPLGGATSCAIYHHRPSPCRRVQPGDALCLRYRREHGIEH